MCPCPWTHSPWTALPYEIYSNIKPNPTIENVQTGVAAFQASGGTAKTTVRTLTLAQVTRVGDDVTLLVEGDAFLYNMVRIIAGTLMEIGLGRRGGDAFSCALESGDRLALGVTAPACGLELTRVYYPEAAFRDPAAIRWHQE